jgi:hypothetical protein
MQTWCAHVTINEQYLLFMLPQYRLRQIGSDKSLSLFGQGTCNENFVQL